jgi:hypothetical protein
MVLLPVDDDDDDDDGSGSGDSVKKSFGRVPTSIEVSATATQDGERTWTMPSTVRMAISDPNDRSPPPDRRPLPSAGGRDAAARTPRDVSPPPPPPSSPVIRRQRRRQR